MDASQAGPSEPGDGNPQRRKTSSAIPEGGYRGEREATHPVAVVAKRDAPTVRLTAEVRDAIVEAVSQGTSLTTAAKLAGLGESTIRQWLRVSETGRYMDGTQASEATRTFLAQFAEQIALARAKFEATVTENLRQAGFRELKGGGVDWRAHLELLKHHPDYRKDWHEQRDMRIEHAGRIDHQHRMASQLSDHDLREALPAEWRELIPVDSPVDSEPI